MPKNIYSPIITSATKKTFFDYIDCLDIPQIDYFAVGVQSLRSKRSISIMSLTEWQRVFVANCYAEHDPIRRATLHTKRNVIPFFEIDYVDNFGKAIMRHRSLLGIKNGIILMERGKSYNYMITLGTAYSKFDHFSFMRRYYEKLLLLKRDLIEVIKKDATQFIYYELLMHSQGVTHPSGDAR